MLHYILQTLIFQLIFLVVYDVFLKKETFFNHNRFYLLGTAISSVVLPFIKLDAFKAIVPQKLMVNLPTIILGEPTTEHTANLTNLSDAIAPSIWDWPLVLYLGIGIAFMVTLIKMIHVIALISKSNKRWKRHFWLVTLKGKKTAFSFFNYVCLGDNLNPTDKQTILNHELVHVKQKHTIDLLLFEMLRIIFWFNPLLYIYQKKVSALHEYMADAEAIKHQDKSVYYQNLLTQVFDTNRLSFINTFYKKSLIKKRIVMLSKNKSKQNRVMKYVLIVPVIFCMLLYTSCEQSAIENEERDLSEYSYTLKVNEDMPASIKKIHDAYEAFLKVNKDYVSWAIFDTKNKEVSYSIHSKDEKVPEGFSKTEVNFPDGTSYSSYMNFGSLYESPSNKEDSMHLTQHQEIPYAVIDKVPSYEDCQNMTEEQKRKCTSDIISQFVNKNFNINLANKLQLKGRQRIITAFKINKEGNIIDVKVRAPHPELKSETERVIKLIPRMIPGEHDGKKVIVPYSLPITFQIND